MRFSLDRLQWGLIQTFVLLGPLGNLFVPNFLPNAFRLFYVVLAFFPLFYRFSFTSDLRFIISLIPISLYCLISAFLVEHHITLAESYPLFRISLLLCEMLFIFGAACFLRDQKKSADYGHLIKLYLFAYLFSALLCAIGYIGFYLGKISFETLNTYSIEAQFAYGFLRFSPGSYPNEYGITASFVTALLTVMLLHPKKPPFKFPKFLIYSSYLISFIILILMTTRASYLTYFLSLIYLTWTSPYFRRYMCKLVLLLIVILSIGYMHFSTLFNLTTSSIQSLSWSEGSSGLRLKLWLEGFNTLSSFPLLGTGWGTQIHIHNTYLQFLTELGMIGSLLLAFPLISNITTKLFMHARYKLRKPLKYKCLNDAIKEKAFLKQVGTLGLIHLLSFALTNHNINHHLTWFTFLLLISQQKPLLKSPFSLFQ